MSELISSPSGKWFQVMYLFNTSLRLRLTTKRLVSLIHTFYTIGSSKGSCRSLSIALFYSYWRLCSWGHFECASWFFIVHFGVHLYFPSLANENLWFSFKLLRFYRRQVIFSLSLMLFGWWISDLRKSYECFCWNYNIGSLSIHNPLLSWCVVKFGRL